MAKETRNIADKEGSGTTDASQQSTQRWLSLNSSALLLVVVVAVSIYYQARTTPEHSPQGRRQLSVIEQSDNEAPKYMESILEDLEARIKLMEETPPQEVKYWFEYAGPLQVSSQKNLC